MIHDRLSERDIIKRAATRDLPRTPLQSLVRALVRLAVAALVLAILLTLMAMVFSLQPGVPR